MSKLKIISISFISVTIISLVLAISAYFHWIAPYLPDASKIRDVSLSEPMKIYTQENLLISQIGVRKRYIIEHADIPQHLIDSLLVIEDNRFYEHFGVDILGLVRAFIELVKTGQKKQGASTLTMQLARNLFLTKEKSFLRKFREIFLALRLESVYSKNEILTLYINRVFLGHRSYGFEAAAQTYFGKKLKQLSLAELALLAGLPKAPSTFNPLSNVERAKVRRDYILLRLWKTNIIDEATYLIAVSEPIKPKKHSAPVDINAGHVADMAQREAVDILHKKGLTEGIYEKGFKVFTTINGAKQKTAYASVQQGVLDYIHRHKWSGVEKITELRESITILSNTLSLTQKNKLIQVEAAQNTLVGATQEIKYIDGLIRGVIYHSDGNYVYAMLEDNQVAQLLLKDVLWAKKTWTKETSENFQLKNLAKDIKEDINALLEDKGSEIYFSPYLTAEIRYSNQDSALPVGGLIYVRKAKGEHVPMLNATATNSTETNSTATSSTATTTTIDIGVYRLYSKPKVQSALVSINVKNGAIISLVGGFNYHNYKFNRATQSARQPGSNFKPFLYAAALDTGMTAATVIDDIPISFEDKNTGFIWTPNNYSGKYYGATRLRDALTFSRNLVSIKLMTEIGIDNTIRYMDNFGFPRTHFIQNRNLSISLGSAPLSPLNVARGYAVFANGGHLVEPYLISKIEDGDGNIIYSYTPPVVCYTECEQEPQADELADDSTDKLADELTQVNAPYSTDNLSHEEDSTPVTSVPRTLDEDVSYIITDILRDVIKRGTGRRAKALKRPDIAGKTGTTNDQYDAWFSGYNHSIATTVWVGYDSPKSMGDRETGGRAALPIWINFMREALKDIPVIELPRSGNLIDVRISQKNGKPVGSSGNKGEKTMFEIFRSQHAPSISNSSYNENNPNEQNNNTPKNNDIENNLIKELF